MINVTSVDNSLSSGGGLENTSICNNTLDKIYLLSVNDAMALKNIFLTEKDFIGKFSDYARSLNNYDDNYVLPRTGSEELYLKTITEFGFLKQSSYSYFGVRPVCEITVKWI